jgi:hypothetical protein
MGRVECLGIGTGLGTTHPHAHACMHRGGEPVQGYHWDTIGLSMLATCTAACTAREAPELLPAPCSLLPAPCFLLSTPCSLLFPIPRVSIPHAYHAILKAAAPTPWPEATMPAEAEIQAPGAEPPGRLQVFPTTTSSVLSSASSGVQCDVGSELSQDPIAPNPHGYHLLALDNPSTSCLPPLITYPNNSCSFLSFPESPEADVEPQPRRRSQR